MKPFVLAASLLIAGMIVARCAAAADEALKSAVVRIEVEKLVTRTTSAGNLRTNTETYVGSGFWVAGTNRIVTCAHVLDGARHVSVSRYAPPAGTKPWSTKDGQVALCLSDPSRDLAIIQVPDVGLGLPLSTKALTPGAAIRSVGHTDDVPWRVNSGHYTEKYVAREIEVPLEGNVLVCDVSFGPGSSGGIVVDGANQIVGMIEGGKSGGMYGTRIAVPAATIQSALSALGEVACHGGLISTGKAIVADENMFADLIRTDGSEGEAFPARLWVEGAAGMMVGSDRFDELVPAVEVELQRSWTQKRTWLLRGQFAGKNVDRTVHQGLEQVADEAELQRYSVTAGLRFLLKEYGRVSMYSTAAAGYVHEDITHDYTFSSPLYAPQSYDSPASGALGELTLDAEIQVVTNLRLVLSGEMWQASGDIGNGVTAHVGLRFGVGRGAS